MSARVTVVLVTAFMLFSLSVRAADVLFDDLKGPRREDPRSRAWEVAFAPSTGDITGRLQTTAYDYSLSQVHVLRAGEFAAYQVGDRRTRGRPTGQQVARFNFARIVDADLAELPSFVALKGQLSAPEGTTIALWLEDNEGNVVTNQAQFEVGSATNSFEVGLKRIEPRRRPGTPKSDTPPGPRGVEDDWCH